MKRQRGVETDRCVKINDLVIDTGNYTVYRGGESLDLTFKEYELLRFLTAHRGKVFTREILLQQIWGYDYQGGTRTVDVHILRLRSKLGRDYSSFIRTVRNVGYQFIL
jgi:DNA-binding response OmpR family regulator